MRQLGLIDVNPVSISEATVDKSSIYNKFLPTNLIEKFAKENGLDPKAPGTIYAAIAKFSLQSMSDMIEFEKLIHGDIGYHKDITSVNKRYSGIVSTMDLTPDHGTIKNEFEDDILFESRTYNKMGVNTTKVFNWAAFTGDVMHAIGISVDLDSFLKRTDEGEVGIDPNELLVDTPEGKKLNPKVTSKELVARFIEFRDKGLKMGMTDGKPATDEELAQRIVENVQTRFEGYLDIDPTDAQAIISPSMFRQ